MITDWIRQEGEPAKAYAGAQIYFELGKDRTLKKVAERVGVTDRTIQNWSSRWNWIERAAAFDRHNQTSKLQIEEEELRRSAREEAQRWAEKRAALREEAFDLGSQLISRAKEMLRFPLHEAKRNEKEQTVIIKPVKWNANSLVNTLRLAIDLKALATGLAAGTDPLDELDFEQMTTEDLEAILQDRRLAKEKKQ